MKKVILFAVIAAFIGTSYGQACLQDVWMSMQNKKIMEAKKKIDEPLRVIPELAVKKMPRLPLQPDAPHQNFTLAGFSNDWKTFFQWLENFAVFFQ